MLERILQGKEEGTVSSLWAKRELGEMERFHPNLRGDNARKEQEQRWLREEETVPKWKQGAVIEEKKSPWLHLPTSTHINLAWEFFGGKFADKRMDCKTLYGDERYANTKQY